MKTIDSIDIFLSAQKVGRMALTPELRCAFEYDTDFLESGFSISPIHLPLKSGVFIAKSSPFNGGFGVFDDSLPDGWGSLILDRFLKNKGINPATLAILDRLALVGSIGRGALEFYPDLSEKAPEEIVDFNELSTEAEKILTTEYSGKGLDNFYQHGGSPGGARPKIFISLNRKEWLVKFKATQDLPSVGETEYRYSILAKSCGINMPETQLFEGKYFGVTRFDRTSEGKIHTISAAGLLNANYREPSLDYLGLLQLCHYITKNMEEVIKLFRLMVFNVVIKNKDDHAKNFSFQWINNVWKLSPAYDLLPSDGFNGFHTTSVNNCGSPNNSDMLTVADKIGIPQKTALNIIEEISNKHHDFLINR